MAVVIEDDDDIRELICALLTQSGYTVFSASTGLLGVQLVRDHAPHICTIDLGLPDFDGFEAIRRIRLFSDCYVIVITARSDEADTLYGLEIGADDYVVKPFRPREVRARLSAMLRRPRSRADTVPARTATASPLSAGEDGVFSHNGLVVDPLTHSVARDGTEVELTPTEFRLLVSILDGRRRVRSKSDLVRTLRDDHWVEPVFTHGSGERAVEVHIGNLRRKLGDSARAPRWIETVRGIGYRLASPER